MKEAIVTAPPQTQALEVAAKQEVGPALPPEGKAPITAAQAKIDAVASLTMTAYQNASTLKLTPEEVSSLQADFPDEAFKPGAAGKEHLIYIEHAFLRDRLNQVFGPAQWSIIPRNRWAEPFTTQKGTEGSRVYVEAMLVIRGAFVAEAVGAMEYYPKNESQNYGDAVEGAKTAALRRCAKELGIGLQAWKQDWCEGWWKRRRAGKNAPGASRGVSDPARSNKTAATPTPATPPAGKAPASPPVRPMKPAIYADNETRDRLIRGLESCRDLATEYFQKVDALLDTERLEDLPLRFVPVTKRQFEELQSAIVAFGNGEPALLAFKPNEEAAPPESPRQTAQKVIESLQQTKAKAEAAMPKPARAPRQEEKSATTNTRSPERRDPEWFFVVVCPIPNKGQKRDDYLKHPDTILSLYTAMKSGDLDAQKRLWGFAKHWTPTEREFKGKIYPISEEDELFREALDAFVEWEEKHGRDTRQPELPSELPPEEPEEDDLPF